MPTKIGPVLAQAEGACIVQTTVEDKESGNNVAAVNCYFMSQDGSMFKAQVHFSPYFYLQIKVRPLCSQPYLLLDMQHAARHSFSWRSTLALMPLMQPTQATRQSRSKSLCWHALRALWTPDAQRVR